MVVAHPEPYEKASTVEGVRGRDATSEMRFTYTATVYLLFKRVMRSTCDKKHVNPKNAHTYTAPICWLTSVDASTCRANSSSCRA